MNRRNTALFLMAGAVFASGLGLACVQPRSFSAAANEVDPETEIASTVGSEVSPILFTDIAVMLDGGDGTVIATAKNMFTLFPTVVGVVLQLYCSPTYCEDYKEMKLVSMTSIEDLDQGHSITTECSTGGEQKYWIGRARFRENNGDWKEVIVGPGLFSASGEYLGLA